MTPKGLIEALEALVEQGIDEHNAREAQKIHDQLQKVRHRLRRDTSRRLALYTRMVKANLRFRLAVANVAAQAGPTPVSADA
jgi:uncharacterized protein with von Willebrand factor type A (vWA) domain